MQAGYLPKEAAIRPSDLHIPTTAVGDRLLRALMRICRLCVLSSCSVRWESLATKSNNSCLQTERTTEQD